MTELKSMDEMMILRDEISALLANLTMTRASPPS